MDLTEMLDQAFKCAQFVVEERKVVSTKLLSQLELPSAISSQISKKYDSNKKIKTIYSVKLAINHNNHKNIKFNNDSIKALPRSLNLDNEYFWDYEGDIRQIELDETYLHISFAFKNKTIINQSDSIWADLNSTGHIAVMNDPSTGLVKKYFKNAHGIRQKYNDFRKSLK
jgi:transposase